MALFREKPPPENVMTARQHAANRSNATKSTGPRTAAGDLIRLTAEDLRDPRRRPARASALRESWTAVERHLRAAGWRFSCVSPGVPIAPTQTAVLEAGDGDDRRVLVVCPGRAVYDLRFRRAGGEQWAAAADGAELGRAAVPPLDRPWNPIDDFPFGGDAYTLGDAFGGIYPPYRQRAVTAAAIGPAAVSVHALPTELLPAVAGTLAAHLHAPDRRVRAGEAAPGAHVFEYASEQWRYVRTLNAWESGRAADIMYAAGLGRATWFLKGILLDPDSRPQDGRVRPRLLVRVGAGGRPRPTILMWGRDYSYDLWSWDAGFLPLADFDRAAGYLRLSADRFAVDTPDKARALFRPQKG